MSDHVHDIFVDLHAVGRFGKRAEGQAQFVLGGRDFMVVLVARQAHFKHGRNHLAANVLSRIDRSHGEIAALGARAVAHIAALIAGARVRRQLDVVELV